MRTPLPTLALGASITVLVLAALLAASAAAAPVRISTDPYRSPTVGQHATEVEPDSFARGSTIVTAFQVGRTFDGGGAGAGWATSTNRGSTWRHGILPGITTASGGPYNAVSDAAVAYDAKHSVWLIVSLAITSSPVRGVAIVVSRSTDGGITWKNPVTVAKVTGSSDFDKPWIVCDNGASTSTHYGSCYAQWDDFGAGARILTSRSTNGGVTWGAHQATLDQASGLGTQPLVQPNGNVIVPYDSATEDSINAFRSTDGGASWSIHNLAATVMHHTVAGNVRSGALPSAEIDATGRVYVAWEDCRFRSGCSANDIVLMHSDDGLTWSSPARVPTGPASGGQEEFVPGLAVDPASSGGSTRLALAFHHMPMANCDASSCRIRISLALSGNGGAGWGSPVRLTGLTRPTWLAFTSEGYMTGDYISTSFVAGTPHAVFALGRCPAGGRLDEAIYQAAPPPAGQAPPSTCPPPPAGKRMLSSLDLKPSKFHARKKGPSVGSKGGTLVSYQSSGGGDTRFMVQRWSHGKWVTAKGHFWHRDARGGNSFHFTGHIGGVKLKTGTYRLLAEPRANHKSAGDTVRKRFTILAANQSYRKASRGRAAKVPQRTAR